ncbi:hypothetical protein SEPCBS119000_006455 [Sporothrix epigloea]|uniref:Uncharacterized protein n=1 Tax=Sporothrix epigloea TaxID=1892477 RepID=A0ABP0E336_9PEZI
MAYNKFYVGSGVGGNPKYGRDVGGPPPRPLGFASQHLNVVPCYAAAVNGSWPYVQPQIPMAMLSNPCTTTTSSPISIIKSPSVIPQGQNLHPTFDRNFPNCNMRNTTGGFGCEPGYNYFFPAEHTKMHVLKTGSTPPWQLPQNATTQFYAIHVSVNTTIGELLKGFGATNSVPGRNVITEIYPAGGGKWYKGIEASGANADMMRKPIKDLGWDATRTGLRGQKSVVYVYVQSG